MYGSVPSLVLAIPIWVVPICFEKPKSAILSCRSAVKRTFSGLISLWKTPLWWRKERPSRRFLKYILAIGSGKEPEATKSNISPPSATSYTTYALLQAVPSGSIIEASTAWPIMFRIFGWWRWCVFAISDAKSLLKLNTFTAYNLSSSATVDLAR